MSTSLPESLISFTLTASTISSFPVPTPTDTFFSHSHTFHPSHPHNNSDPGSPPPPPLSGSSTNQVTAYDPAHSEGFGGPLAQNSLRSLSHALPIYIAGAAIFLALIVLLSVVGWYIRRRRRIGKVVKDFGEGRESKEWKATLRVPRDIENDQGWVSPTFRYSPKSQEAKTTLTITNIDIDTDTDTNTKKKEERENGIEEAAPPYEKVETKRLSISIPVNQNQPTTTDRYSTVNNNNINNGNEDVNGSTVHVVPASPHSHIDHSKDPLIT